MSAISWSDFKEFDFLSIQQEKGVEYAKVRRHLYRKRHEKDVEIKGLRGYLSSILLWWFRISIDNNPETHRRQLWDSSTITPRLIDGN